MSWSQVADYPGTLFLPYVVWVAFANVLNFSIWRGNLGAARDMEPHRGSAPTPGGKSYGGSNARVSLTVFVSQ